VSICGYFGKSRYGKSECCEDDGECFIQITFSYYEGYLQ
jgi:hypothetical protein